MVAAIIGFVLVTLVVVGPLAWLAWGDRRRARALAIRAEVQSVVDHTLQGESFVSVRVRPSTWRRQGSVVLAMPRDWSWLVEEVWAGVLPRVPAGYEVVLDLWGRAQAPDRTPHTLPRAA